MSLGLDEVVSPHMVAMLRPQTDTGSVVEPPPGARWLLLGYFQPLTASDPLDPVTHPTCQPV
jgi:hypothetical protein